MRALLILLALAGAAAADTGGSMGGGDWDSSSSSSSSSSSDWSSDSGGGSDMPAPVAFTILGLCVVIWVILALVNDSSGNAPAGDSVDVSVLRIAIDGRARTFVQTELKKVAHATDTATAAGRADMLREVARLLRRLRDAWVYGGAVNEPMRNIQTTRPIFDRYVDDARSRFREETIRNEQGVKTSTAPSSYTPRTDEGAGLILVSVIIAARRELFTVNQIADGEELRQALDAASQLTLANLVAIEIVWQPSEDADRLSSIELEAKYPPPELVKIAGALAGKTFCTFCGGPYPAELVSCPHCGAPAHKEAA